MTTLTMEQRFLNGKLGIKEFEVLDDSTQLFLCNYVLSQSKRRLQRVLDVYIPFMNNKVQDFILLHKNSGNHIKSVIVSSVLTYTPDDKKRINYVFKRVKYTEELMKELMIYFTHDKCAFSYILNNIKHMKEPFIIECSLLVKDELILQCIRDREDKLPKYMVDLLQYIIDNNKRNASK